MYLNIKKLEDDSYFPPFGKYQGHKMGNVRAGYLLWLWDQWKLKVPKSEGAKQVYNYVEENMDVLQKQKKDEETGSNSHS